MKQKFKSLLNKIIFWLKRNMMSDTFKNVSNLHYINNINIKEIINVSNIFEKISTLKEINFKDMI